VAALLYLRGAAYVRVEDSAFRQMWDRWRAVHGSPPGVIVRQPQPSGPPPHLEPDITDYSFDRAVLCDRARTVDLLVANNFHFENNCAVLSAEGYPANIFETVRVMLKRNPRLQVFALHDATPAGCQLAHRLSTDPTWFAGQARVIDVGLRPAQARRFRGLLLHPSGPAAAAGDGISAAEAAWLSAHALELAAVRPEQVLKRLFRAINAPVTPKKAAEGDSVAAGGGDGGAVVVDGSSFAVDAPAMDGGADAFG
jgi:hypothetical protein